MTLRPATVPFSPHFTFIEIAMENTLLIKSRLAQFAADDSGAVTVDWVVLTAAVVGLVSAIFVTLGNDTSDYSEDIGSFMQSQGIKTSY